MRSAGCAVQQGLTSEAAAVVKQAVVLAKRRGHAQVTPMHVATTMLAVGGGLLRAACLQSHSHPLQCKALELCFNVALNRLPTASSNPISGHHAHYPSISNALVAAFKRAQAHQRRGASSADSQQQQPLLTVKIELEQLIISILDDPSVSRVMREAGFSSPQVKNIVEKSTSLDHENPSPAGKSKENKVVILDPSSPPSSRQVNELKDDLNIVIEALLTSKKNRSNFVVVGESICNVEKTVRELMDRVERGGVPEGLREVKFITIPPFYSFCSLRRELVQQKMEELAFVVKSLVGKGVVLYLGDLKWISEYRVSEEREREYCSVEHMIMELGRLVSGMGEINGRFWVMGIGTFQTYMRCRNGYNSLQNIWRLHPLTIPANTLGLTLVPHSHSSGNEDGEARNERSDDDEINGGCQLLISDEEEVKFQNGAALSTLPPWLKDETRRLAANFNHQNCDSIKEESSHSHRQARLLERSLTLSSASPSSSNSCFSFDPQSRFPPLPQNLLSNPDSPSSDAQKFKEFSANNLNILCNALEEKLPRRKLIIPEIAGTILQCRSGMVRRKCDVSVPHDTKEETWLLFLGQDAHAKEEISRSLAKLVFGSYSNMVSIGINSLMIMTDDDDNEVCSSYVERFAREVSANPHRVFLLEDLERVDCASRGRIKRAIETGRMSDENGEEFSLFDAIVVLSTGEDRGRSGTVSLDLNIMSTSFRDDSVEKLESFDDFGILQNVDRIVDFF